MGIGRRSLLRVGLSSAVALGLRPAFAVPRSIRGHARACILLYMEGGASQIDTWDPKPGRSTGGPFQAIESSVPGIRISEHLPLLAARMRQLAVIRTVTSVEGNHLRARQLAHESISGGNAHAPMMEPAEPPSEELVLRYGSSAFGRGCLRARRLVESGATFVQVRQPGWDTHADNFEQVRRLSGDLDRGMSALLDDLSMRGLLQSTLVVWMGDFGRTPTINAECGRDHFPSISSVVLAGGGLRTGQAIGTTDIDGREILDRPVTVPELARTLAYRLNGHGMGGEGGMVSELL